MKIISFAYTAEEFMAKRKCMTRREWKDNYAKTFHIGETCQAYDKNPRNGGKLIGWLTILNMHKELLSEMPKKDLDSEGGTCKTVKEFIDRYFGGDKNKIVWVIHFMSLTWDEDK